MENPNPTYADELIKRNQAQERTIERQGDLPSIIDFRSHCHVAVRGGLFFLTAWFVDPVSKEREYTRIAMPYNHFLLIARGVVDGHDESEALAAHPAGPDE